MVEALAVRMRSEIERRVEERIALEQPAEDGVEPPRLGVPLASLGLGIPLSAIGARAGVAGLLPVWLGIVGVNTALARRG